jgi:hypothetical protein
MCREELGTRLRDAVTCTVLSRFRSCLAELRFQQAAALIYTCKWNGYPNFIQTQTQNYGYPKLRVPESSGTSTGSTVGNPK